MLTTLLNLAIFSLLTNYLTLSVLTNFAISVNLSDFVRYYRFLSIFVNFVDKPVLFRMPILFSTLIFMFKTFLIFVYLVHSNFWITLWIWIASRLSMDWNDSYFRYFGQSSMLVLREIASFCANKMAAPVKSHCFLRLLHRLWWLQLQTEEKAKCKIPLLWHSRDDDDTL